MDSLTTPAACIATNYSPWVGFHFEIPAEHIAAAIRNPDAIQVAAQLGRLDFLAALLACLGIILAVAGVVGYAYISDKTNRLAKAEAQQTTRVAVPEFLKGDDGAELIRAALSDPVVIATIQARLWELGIGNVASASSIDTEPFYREGETNGN